MSSTGIGAAAPSTIIANPDAAPAAKPKHKGFSFGDLLDVINPLQHIPIVSTIYRAITHDRIRPEAQIAGDALFGGPIGFVASVADQAIASKTGKTLEGHVMAMFSHHHHGRVDVGPVQIASAAHADAAPGAAIPSTPPVRPKVIPAPAGPVPTISAAALDHLMQSVNATRATELTTLAQTSAAPPQANTRDDAYRKALQAAEAAMQKWRQRSGADMPPAVPAATIARAPLPAS